MFRSIVYLSFIISIVKTDLFDVNPIYFADNPECIKLNATLYSYIDDILDRLNETAEFKSRGGPEYRHIHVLGVVPPDRSRANETKPKLRVKRETIKKFYNFTMLPPGNESNPIHLYGIFHLEKGKDFKSFFDEKYGENPLVKLLPAFYQIQLITIDGSDEPFTYIEGVRCKWRCSKATQECEEKVCWDYPSLCRGNHETCISLDGNGTCYDLQEQPNQPEVYNLWRSNSTHKVFTNIDIGRYLHYHGEDGITISHNGHVMDILKVGYHWTCEEVDAKKGHILCRSDWSHVGITTHLLKTLAG